MQHTPATPSAQEAASTSQSQRRVTDGRPGDTSVPGPLSGVVVADFGRVLAAPYATMLLADLGADVIKVERPGAGDDTRAWGPPHAHGESTYFLSVNRNKRSFAIDLGTPEGRRDAHELVRRADVLFENFRPGTMDRHGLSYAQAEALNPGIVYCSVTGFDPAKAPRCPATTCCCKRSAG